MTEYELKCQVPPQAVAAVERALSTATAHRVHLQAIYHDTADRRLAAAGLALRLRKEGRRWVQTLKGRGDGLLGRLEHNAELPAARGTPVVDAARHAGTPAGDALQAVLGDAILVPIFETDVRRLLGVSPSDVHARIESLIQQGRMLQGGLGLYRTFVHYDIRGARARW